MKNCVIICNPNSGHTEKKELIKKFLEILRNKGYTTEVIYTKYAGHAKEIVHDLDNNIDLVISLGGDGTFNNVACGISGCEDRPVLGYIPAGTGCDIARNLRIPRNIKKAIKIIKDGYTIQHDVGMINDSYFMYVVGIGACTGTPYTTKHETKKILGRLAYVIDGLDEFFHAPVNEVKIITESQTIKATVPLLLIMNTISVGGIPFNRYCHLNDGLFDVVLINNGASKGRFNILNYFIKGILGLRNKKNAVTLSASEMRIEIADELNWCVDGEKGPKGSVTIRNLHNHLMIITPKRKAKTQKKNTRN